MRSIQDDLDASGLEEHDDAAEQFNGQLVGRREEHDDTSGETIPGKWEATRESEKGLYVVKRGGGGTFSERWVPKGQIHANSEVFAKGHIGKLVVTEWLAEKWNDEREQPERKPEETVVVKDVVCLRESAKALLIRQGVDGEEKWIPKGQIVEATSEVLGDGDLGELHITAWIAREKGFAPK